MQVLFYTIKDDIRKLEKELFFNSEKSVTLKEDSDLMNLKVEVDVFENWTEINYVYVPNFKRYYFIDTIHRYNAHLLQVRLTSDLLMTYKDKIVGQNLLITATSQPSYYSAGLPTTQHIELDRYTSDFTLPEGKTMILTTIGG